MAGTAQVAGSRTRSARLFADTGRHRGPDRYWWWVAAITAGAVVVRVLYVLLVARHVKLGLDSVGYLFLGHGVANGDGYSNPTLLFAGRRVATANFPPLYPVFIAAVDKLGLTTTTVTQVASSVVGAATVPLIAGMGKRLVDRRTGLAAAALVAVWPFLLAGDGSMMSETIAVPVVTGAVLATVWAVQPSGEKRFDARRFLVVGALFGIAALARAEAPIVMVCVVGLALLTRRAATRARLVAVGATLLAFAVVSVPWVTYVVRDFGTSGLWATDSAKTLAGANCATTFGGPRIGLWDVSCETSPDWPRVTEADAVRANRRRATHFVRTHLARAPLVASVRVLRTAGLWSPRQQRDFETVESRSRTWQWFAWWCYLLALPFAAWGIARLVRRNPAARAIAGLFVGIAFASALSDGNQRIRLAAEPEILLCAVVGVNAMWSKMSPLRRRPVPAAG
ncbi:MAG TPA: glycosyltransferase family 39 protein [Acidimicrobiia bacterium]